MWPNDCERPKVYRPDDQIITGNCEFYEHSDMDKIMEQANKMRDDAKRWLQNGKEAKDEPKHPDYYKGSNEDGKQIEVFDVIDQFVNCDFYLGNVLKYVCRAGKKSKDTKRQDLEKALHYIKEAIKRCGEPEQEDE